MKFFTTTKISDHQELTPEGFLLARDIRIARTGKQFYRDFELPDVVPNQDGWIAVDRHPEEVFDETSISSFTGKPITNDHPYDVVTPDNWHNLAIGTVVNARRGTGSDHDCLVADLLFTSKRGIDLVRTGKRALSVGYDARYEQTEPGQASQREIIANHVALVDEGRCGARCTIVDGVPWTDVDWVEAEHPRGQPENKGEFASAPGHGVAGLPEGKPSYQLAKLAKRSDTFEMKAEPRPGGPDRYQVIVTAKHAPGINTIGKGHRTIQYDPELAQTETLNADDPIIARDIAVLKPGVSGDLPFKRDPTRMYRGMTSEEFDNFRKTGTIKSLSDYNIGPEQAGLTYWSKDPSEAESYANSFAPAQFKPTFAKPAYIVVAKHAAPEQITQVKGVGSNELGVNRPVDRSDVLEAWRGRVAVLNAGSYDVTDRGGTYEDASSAAPSAELVWERVPLGSADAAADWDEDRPDDEDDIDYDWTEDAEAWETEKRDPKGEWTAGGGSAIPEKHHALLKQIGFKQSPDDPNTYTGPHIDQTNMTQLDSFLKLHEFRSLSHARIWTHPDLTDLKVAENDPVKGSTLKIGKLPPITGGPTGDPAKPTEKHQQALYSSGGGSAGPDHGMSATPADLFVKARDRSARAQFLTPHPAEELTSHVLLTNEDATVGVSVDPHGDVQNVFNNGGPKGGAAPAIVAAIEHGGRTLDCYDGHLNTYYHQFGFEEDSRMKFNPDYAPPGWDFAKYDNPDVVFMSWRGYGEGGADAALKRAAVPKAQWPTPKKADTYGDDWDAAKAGSRAHAAVGGRTGDRRPAGPGPWSQAYRARNKFSAGAGADDRRDLTEDVDYAWTEDLEGFVEAEHPRGQPKNRGEFAKKGSAPAPKAPLPSQGSATGREVKAESARAAKEASATAQRARTQAQLAAMPAKEPDAISTRITSEPQRRLSGDDPHTHPHSLVDWPSALNPEVRPWLKKATDLLTGRELYNPGPGKTPHEYVGMPPGPKDETPEAAAERFIDFAKGNILSIYNAVPKAWRERASHWYDGANKVAKQWGQEYGYSAPQMAGVLAALSPKKDWFQNVDLAKRILDSMQNYQGTRFDDAAGKKFQEFIDTRKEPEARDVYQLMLGGLKDETTGKWKTLGELDDPQEQAAWINMYDLAHADPSFRALSPEGAFGEVVTNKGKPATKTKPAEPGEPTARVWPTIENTAKAIKILKDGSTGNISRNLGEAHKVRNFYMNILHPESPNGHVTIDTHAIAAAFLRPFGQKDDEVVVGLGNASPSNNTYGLGGTYPIIAEAYRRAAKEAGILPRQMQSITWEGLRGLFSPESKRDKTMRKDVEDIWRQSSQGKITAEQARHLVMMRASPELRGAPRTPDWYT